MRTSDRKIFEIVRYSRARRRKIATQRIGSNRFATSRRATSRHGGSCKTQTKHTKIGADAVMNSELNIRTVELMRLAMFVIGLALLAIMHG
jgi:hypothetical protein